MGDDTTRVLKALRSQLENVATELENEALHNKFVQTGARMRTTAWWNRKVLCITVEGLRGDMNAREKEGDND